jgi:hypothetical protein
MSTLNRRPRPWLICLECLLVAVALSACGGRKMQREETFQPNTPFTARVPGDGDVVCWSVKRALLSQGYMLERGGESVVLLGSKEFQPDSDTNVTLRLQATCVDNKDGTSTVFASATREVSKMQNVKQSISAGVAFATVTVPTGSEKVLRVAERQTIQDPKFYDRFYALVNRYVAEDERRSRNHASSRDGRIEETPRASSRD